ncbi:SDR family oxidoreductase [Haloferula sargassicola]|uniref:SDR family oxidoreductase n=1 Tax=Haloferula sargassicola TaxID=490096 RepID=UPI0033659F85
MSESSKVAIVTGAGSGIGKAITERLLMDGWKVFGLDLKASGIPEGAEAIEADVADEGDLRAVIRRLRSRHGRLDALVSNAGLSEFKSLAQCSLDDWNRILTANLTATFLLARECEKLLRESKGAIVATTSTRAHMSEPDTHAYSASKGGLLALTHSLAISLGPDVRVNCISPGWINVSDQEPTSEQHAQHPAGRVGRPEDVASMVAYLLDPEAGFITGAEFILDGGMTRKMIYT